MNEQLNQAGHVRSEGPMAALVTKVTFTESRVYTPEEIAQIFHIPTEGK
jgi:hypothetical protein